MHFLNFLQWPNMTKQMKTIDAVVDRLMKWKSSQKSYSDKKTQKEEPQYFVWIKIKRKAQTWIQILCIKNVCTLYIEHIKQEAQWHCDFFLL